MVRGNCLNAKLNIVRWEKVKKDKELGQWQKLQKTGLWSGQAPPRRRSFGPGKSNVVLLPFLQEPAVSYFFIPLFLIELGSEIFRQEIIYELIFQRHFIVWEKEGGKRKSQYKNKSNLRWIFLRLKICLLLFISFLSFQLYDVIKVPFLTQHFQMIQALGILLMIGYNAIYFGVWKTLITCRHFEYVT